MSTEVKDEGNSKLLTWNETLRIKIKDSDTISFNVLDQQDNSGKVFGYEASAHQFRTQSGHKKFSVNDKSYTPLGILEFDYETLNFVNREESNKNEEKAKEEENFMHKITVDKIKGDLEKDGIDVYICMLVGAKYEKTSVINSAKKDFVQEVKLPFIAESRENKMTFAIWDSNTFSDAIYGVGHLALPATSGEKRVYLNDAEGNAVGSIYVTLTSEKVTCRSMTLSEIKVKMNKSGDILGSSDPYIIAKIGGWEGRTETGEGNEFSFKKSIDLRFDKEN